MRKFPPLLLCAGTLTVTKMKRHYKYGRRNRDMLPIYIRDPHNATPTKVRAYDASIESRPM
jgi:hypothetical protein